MVIGGALLYFSSIRGIGIAREKCDVKKSDFRVKVVFKRRCDKLLERALKIYTAQYIAVARRLFPEVEDYI